MRKVTRYSLALGTSVAMLSLAAFPASADEGDIPAPAPAAVTATVAVPNNGMSISVKSAPAHVDFVFDGVGKDGSATISIPGVTVQDLRAGELGWAVSVELGNFRNAAGKEISTATAAYTASNTGIVGLTSIPVWGSERTFSEAAPEGVNRAAGVVTVESVTGNNEASWDAILSIPVPSTVLAGTYAATLTHSVL